MKSKIFTLSCLVWAIAATSMGSPAQASSYVLIPLENVPEVTEVTEIVVIGKPGSNFNYPNSCGSFIKKQTMIVPGVGQVEALVDSGHQPGLKEAVFVRACGDGYVLFVIF